MKKILLLIMAMSPLFAEIDEGKAQALLKLSEDNTAFYETDFKADYSIVMDKPGEGKSVTEAVMYRRDKTKKWTILINSPQKDKGKGYLQYDDNIWFYDPKDHRFTFTAAKDKFQGTTATNADFAPQTYFSDYDMESYSEVTLGKLNCILYELKTRKSNVDYPRLKLWVTVEDGLMRKKEEYSLSGQKMRTTLVPSYQFINGQKKYYLPVSMLIADNLKGKKIQDKVVYEKTQVSIKNIVFEKVSDTVYTKPYLEMMSLK